VPEQDNDTPEVYETHVVIHNLAHLHEKEPTSGLEPLSCSLRVRSSIAEDAGYVSFSIHAITSTIPYSEYRSPACRAARDCMCPE
jgi:hypothetical protein